MSHYTKKSGKTLARQKRMINKLSPTQAHAIVKDYVKILAGTHSTFTNVQDLLVARKISRNVPSKLKKKFDILWKELGLGKEVDYKVNIFLERSKLRKHRNLPESKEYKEFISLYPRGGHQTYVSWCKQRSKTQSQKKGMFYYYKDATKKDTNSVAPIKKVNKWKLNAKEWYAYLYKTYDFVIHIDGKSMEDQENIWKNPLIKLEVKWLTLAVEARSGILVGIWLEKSHNKTNATNIFKQICDHIKRIFGEDKKICFITDAGSEYVNNKDLRGIEITDKDTINLAQYLRELGHGWRITRRPEDNGFVENKNDYIERACLDNKEILKCDSYGLMCLLDEFVERNNKYLEGAKKSFRGEGITPEANIQARFGSEAGKQWINGIHVQSIEKLHKLPHIYKEHTIGTILDKLKYSTKGGKMRSDNSIFYTLGAMHPKSLDSSKHTGLGMNRLTPYQKFEQFKNVTLILQ